MVAPENIEKSKKKDNSKENVNTSKKVNDEIKERKLKQKQEDVAVSLKEIKEAIQIKLSKQQKNSLIKNIFINLGIAIIMITYLFLIIMGSKNIERIILERDIKIITLSVVAIGIYILELAYKKDSVKLAANAIEVIAFAASNLSLIYILILYFGNLANTVLYIGIGVLAYYVAKCTVISIKNVRKFKKENSDIKEIIKK